MPLNRIKQTSKLLLIEEFRRGDDTPDLVTLLSNFEDGDNMDDLFKNIEQTLEVRSFEEFVEKFMPSVWEWTEKDSSGNICFNYTLEKPERFLNAHEMSLSKNEFYNMVMDLYSQKGTSGSSNLEFDYSRVADLLSPKKIIDNAKQLRKNLQYNHDRYLALGEGSTVEKNKCKRKIMEIRREIVSQYTGSFIGNIKLALADVENKLTALPESQQINNDSETQRKALPCEFKFDDEGDIVPIDVEENQQVLLEGQVYETEENQQILLEGQTSKTEENQLVKWISNDYDQSVKNPSEYVKSLIVSNYCGGTLANQNEDREGLIEKRNQYSRIYKQAQEHFIRAISSAVEKMLDVKVFFEQASIQGRKLPAAVIVTNCKADKLIENEVKDKFTKYIKRCENEPDKYRIWFAIIPAIGDVDFVDNVYDDFDIDMDNVNNNFQPASNVKTQDGDSMINIETLKQILTILKAGRITTFFNYRANENTGFSKFNEDILQKYRTKLEAIEGNPYAVFCYPNFTVLPKKETTIEIGKQTIDGQDRKVFLDIPGIYVNSAYVAAGLVVASQNPEYLQKKGYAVAMNNPCVRFDFEEGNNRFIMLTKMNREGKVAWPTEIEDNIGKDKFGFCFCGNTKYYNNELVKNTYIYVARNMHKSGTGNYNRIYVQLTMDFVRQYLQTENRGVGGKNKISEADITKFLNVTVSDWKRNAENKKYANNVNNILKVNDDITREENKLKMHFEETDTDIEIEIINE